MYAPLIYAAGQPQTLDNLRAALWTLAVRTPTAAIILARAWADTFMADEQTVVDYGLIEADTLEAMRFG